MAQLSFVICSARSDLRDTLEETGHVEVRATVAEPEELAPLVRRHHPDVVFADLGPDPEGTIELLEGLPAPRPLMLLSGPQEDSRLILRAMRLGAREFFPPYPGPEALHAAIERLLLEPGQHAAAPALKARAPVIAVMGAKGGVGATFVACQLAAGLERRGGRAALVDMNLRVGDVALFFDLHPRYTLANVASEDNHVDPAFLHTVLEPHPSGVRVLAAPRRPEDADLIQVAHVERTISVLRGEFDWVLLDVPRSWDETSLRALDLADQIFLVTLMDVPTLNHARQHLDLLQRLGHPLEKIRLIANRYSSSAPVTTKDCTEFLGRSPELLIPNDFPTALACVNEGKPLWEVAPKSSLCTAYDALTRQTYTWSDVQLPSARGRTSGLTGRLRSLLRRKRHASD